MDAIEMGGLMPKRHESAASNFVHASRCAADVLFAG